MKKLTFLLCLFSPIFLSFSQITDHFLDGDFLFNPEWVGNKEQFIINANHELQLNATEAGTAYLSLPSPQFATNWEWNFTIRMPFAPSANNFARVYLTSNTTDLTSLFLKGYYLQFGENLSQDAIELFYQNGSVHTSICRGKEARIAASFAMQAKVKYSEPNFWEILVSENQNRVYETDCSGVSIYQIEHFAMGVFCKYTVSNSKKFYFDDFYYGAPQVDNIKPQVVAVIPQQDGHTIHITYSENVTPETALLPSNYLVNNETIPEFCEFVSSDFTTVSISFSNEFDDRIVQLLTINNIADLSGNIIDVFICNFQFAKIRRNDILITEIMADPTPVVGLPDCEYVELHNFGIQDTIVLKNWKLKINTSTKSLPEIKIPPNGYIYVTPNSCSAYSEENYPHLYRVSSLGIAMGGAQLVLYNAAEEVIHEVKFSSEWHKNKLKINGGWSLEMIDLRNPCSGEDNWDSSISNVGGTPGLQNSIFGNNPDQIPPAIEKITILDSVTVKVFFTEAVFYDAEKMLQLFEIDRNIIIESVRSVPPNNHSLELVLQTPIQPNLYYTLTVKETLYDCAQNLVLVNSSVRFALPSVCLPIDVIINEVLFNPIGSTNADFVELYNRSQKVVDLSTLYIGSGGTDVPDKTANAMSSGFLLFPNEYIVLCKNKSITEEQYYVPHPTRLLKCDSLPSYTNSSGVVFLTDKAYRTIDRFQYTEDMHYPLLSSVEGVSLERVNPNRETQNVNNWKSAAESYGFATPGYQNSHYSEGIENDDLLKVVPEVFVPNQDGNNDYVEFHCRFADDENRVTLSIFDRLGNRIKTIANNQICANTEVFLWDGVTDKNYRVPPDLYIVKLEYWNLNTKRKTIRKSVGVYYP